MPPSPPTKPPPGWLCPENRKYSDRTMIDGYSSRTETSRISDRLTTPAPRCARDPRARRRRTAGCRGRARPRRRPRREHGDLPHRVDAAEVDEDHVDDVLALAVGLRPFDHLDRDRLLGDVVAGVGRGDREDEDRRPDQQRHREAKRAHDRRREIDEPGREEPQHEHEQHRAERLDRELGECEVGRALHLVERGHREPDGTEHHDRRDAPVDQRCTDRRTDDDRDDRELDRSSRPTAAAHRTRPASGSPARRRPWSG